MYNWSLDKKISLYIEDNKENQIRLNRLNLDWIADETKSNEEIYLEKCQKI